MVAGRLTRRSKKKKGGNPGIFKRVGRFLRGSTANAKKRVGRGKRRR